MAALIEPRRPRSNSSRLIFRAKDNAQVIFETSNGRGERLTDADLIRNLLFRKADEEGSDVEKLHESSWAVFDDPGWSDRSHTAATNAINCISS